MALVSGDREAARRQKMERIRPILRSDMRHVWRNGRVDYLTDELRRETRIVDTSNVSSLGYDADMLALIEKHGGGLVLDCGAGSKSEYYSNVVNLEIVEYGTTDVLGVGEHLPFVGNCFDAVMSIAVLEHVRDPIRCAQEIVRVLKPGGDLLCAVPFLSPVHGYPHHYFNSTPQGHRRLFEDGVENIRLALPDACHPIHSLHWILTSWANGLPAEPKEQLLGMRVSDLLASSSWAMMGERFVRELPEARQYEIAAGTVLTAQKPMQAGSRLTYAAASDRAASTLSNRQAVMTAAGKAFEAAFGHRARLWAGRIIRQLRPLTNYKVRLRTHVQRAIRLIRSIAEPT